MAIFAIVRDPARFRAFFSRRRPLVNQSLGFDLSDAASVALASFGWCALSVARMAHALSCPQTRERLVGGYHAEGLLVWCGGPVHRCIFRRWRDGPERACSVATSDAAAALRPFTPWCSSDWLTRYDTTRWGETLFEELYRPKDYVDATYAWGWEDGPIQSDRF
jgi:hypothetical protein